MVTSTRIAPVLLLVFRRPETTAKVLEQIRAARPSALFVAGDAARADRPEEAAKVRRTRELVESSIDWPCDVEYLWREENLGCRRAVSEAITWFFSHLPEGIILEDDCVPDPSFFPYCTELLERYRNEPRVLNVCANNNHHGRRWTRHPYYFSIYFHCWGWATWARSWQHYNHDINLWFEQSEETRDGFFATQVQRKHFDEIFRNLLDPATAIDSWAYRWSMNTFLQRGLNTYPEVNLVENIGLATEATHEHAVSSPVAGSIQLTSHPTTLQALPEADTANFYRAYAPWRKPPPARPPWYQRMPRRLARSVRKRLPGSKERKEAASPPALDTFDPKTAVAHGAAVSYAQEGEDLVVDRYLREIPHGCYVDVGANHPVRFSNTAKLYRRKWSGVCVEPNPELCQLFTTLRPRDHVFNCGVAAKETTLTYYQFNEPALNTFEEARAEKLRQLPQWTLEKTTEVRCRPLNEILTSVWPDGINIDFLSIDAEGMDYEILTHHDFARFPVSFLLVEDHDLRLEALHDSPQYRFLRARGFTLTARLVNSCLYRQTGER